MTLPSANFGHKNLPCPTENNVSTALKHTASVVCVHVLVYDEKQALAKYLNMALATKRFLFLLIAVLVASTPAEAKKAKVTHIEFYMHDIVGGPNPTAVRVAGRGSNFSSSDPIASMFGSIFVMDNPLTATPDLNSTLMGRAQGIYAMSSQHDEFSLLMTLTYNFISEAYNGSSFSVVGQNPVMREVREMPIVGGTGMFRLARGYCLAKTFSTNQMDAVIGYNATVIHY